MIKIHSVHYSKKSSFQGYFWLIFTSHQLKSEDDLRLFESWATETYFRRCEEEPQPLNTQLENLKVWDQKEIAHRLAGAIYLISRQRRFILITVLLRLSCFTGSLDP